MLYRFLGDCHGKFRRYKKLIAEYKITRQVGDFGVGFYRYDQDFNRKLDGCNPPFDHMARGDHKFNRGNHDNPQDCAKHKFWIPDGHIEQADHSKIMYIGGALSTDRSLRLEGFNWWPDEELSYNELMLLLDVYTKEKPDVLVTHDCPESIAQIIEPLSGRRKLDLPSRTRQALQSMLEIHKPKLHVFGHWHYSMDTVIEGTRYRCLAELEPFNIDL